MNLGKYLAWFTGATVVIAALYAFLDAVIAHGGVNLGLLVPLFASWIAVDQFVKDHNRIPDDRERRWLIWSSFAVSVGIAVLGLAALAISGGLAQMADVLGTGWLAGLLAVGLALTLGAIWAGYGWMGKRALRNRQRAAERKQRRAAGG